MRLLREQNSEIVARAEQLANGHAPRIGENGRWWNWNYETGAYEDSGISAVGGEETLAEVRLLLEQNSEIVTRAEQIANEHAPRIGENGHWWNWNYETGMYEDSGISAAGVENPAPADAETLGGKAPKHYLPARNLLDNSDLSRPVNQRGETVFSPGADARYYLDRWQFGCCAASLVTGGVSLAWDGVNGTGGYMRQAVGLALETGANYTIAVKRDGEISAYSFVMPGEETEELFFGEETVGLLNEGGCRWVVVNNPSTAASVVEWAALYEGAYTAENLPPYEPKGYTAELLECQRYFWSFPMYGDYGLSFGDGSMFSTTVGRIPVQLPCPMRVTPTVGTHSGVKINIHSEGKTLENVTLTVLCQTGSKVMLQMRPANGATTTQFTTFGLVMCGLPGAFGYLYLSADL